MDDGSVEDGEVATLRKTATKPRDRLWKGVSLTQGGRRNWVGPKLLLPLGLTSHLVSKLSEVRPFFCQLLAALSVFDLALR